MPGLEIAFIDHGLDISAVLPGDVITVDGEEFFETVQVYGYPAELQAACFQAVDESKDEANDWIGKPMRGRKTVIKTLIRLLYKVNCFSRTI